LYHPKRERPLGRYRLPGSESCRCSAQERLEDGDRKEMPDLVPIWEKEPRDWARVLESTRGMGAAH